MITFKQYFLEGIASSIAGMGDSALKAGKQVVDDVKKGGQRIKKEVTSDKGIGQKVDGVADAVVDTTAEVVDDVATTEIGGEDKAPSIESIKTFEDLREVINDIITQKKHGRVKDSIASAVGSFVPGLGTVQDTAGVITAIADKPDEVKVQTGSVIDKLDIDDQLATIVDDRIEDNFLAHMQKKIEKETGPVPANWNINIELKQYLANKFGGRTVTGDQA